MTQEGAAVVKDTIEFLKKQPAVPPVTLDMLLSLAAEDHAKDIGPKGITAHEGSDGSTTKSRIEKHCDWKVTMGENLEFGGDNPRDVVLNLLIDDGVPSRGHRLNLLNPAFLKCGIATGPHTQFRTCCVMDFAGDVGPKTQKLATTSLVTDATNFNDPKVQAILTSIPFDNMRDQVKQAMASGQKVDLDYKPGSITIKIKSGGGFSSMSGNWSV